MSLNDRIEKLEEHCFSKYGRKRFVNNKVNCIDDDIYQLKTKIEKLERYVGYKE